MKLEHWLKVALVILIVALVGVSASWLSSEFSAARAQGGGGSSSGTWMMVATELHSGEGLIYMFNTEKEVLLVYAYHRGLVGNNTRNTFQGDLQFLAGRYTRWDLLYSQLVPYPYTRTNPPSSPSILLPNQMKDAYEKAAEAANK